MDRYRLLKSIYGIVVISFLLFRRDGKDLLDSTSMKDKELSSLFPSRDLGILMYFAQSGMIICRLLKGHDRNYFTAPATTPEMIAFWRTRYMTSIGRTVRIKAAMIRP